MARDIPRAGASVFRGAARVAVAFLLAACGGDDDGANDDGAGGADAAPAGDGSTDRATDFEPNPVGTVQLVESNVAGLQSAQATLRDRAEQPPALLLASEGDCEIWTHALEPAQCDPPCQGGYCVSDGQCEPFPEPISAGEIEVTGLTQDLRFVPEKFGYTSQPDILPEDLFDDGAAIEVTAPGGDAPGFTLSATGVAPLVADLDLDFDVTLVIEDQVDEVIRWTPASSGRIQLGLQVGWHGAAYEALLLCEADDADGELVVPGSLIERFPPRADPTGEQHGSWMARFTRDVIDTDAGPLELFIASRLLILQIDHR